MDAATAVVIRGLTDEVDRFRRLYESQKQANKQLATIADEALERATLAEAEAYALRAA